MTSLFRNVCSNIRQACSLSSKCEASVIQVRTIAYKDLINPKPTPGPGKCFRRIVHYEDEYTVKPLKVTNLGGRDPVSGRVVVKGIGGGIKHKYHWIQWKRAGPTEADVPPVEERVIQIFDDGCRTSKVALVASGDEMKYYLATANMKAGDIVRTSSYIPRIPVNPNEGDAYPLGALPEGTLVHNIERYPGAGGCLIHSAGAFATIKGKQEGKIVVKMPSKHEFRFDPHCMACVGRLSNLEHSSTPIGSAQRNRELGNRPRSGLWQRKTGRFGRKIKAPKTFTIAPKPKPTPLLVLNM